MRVWVDGKLLLDRWGSPSKASGTIALQAGRKYDIKVEYQEKAGDAHMRVAWSSPSQEYQLIPQSRLYPSASTGSIGTGLKGEYFADAELSALKFTRINPTVNVGWEYKRTAKAGYAVVASRAENKAAFIDLQPLFQYYRTMYFTTQANYDATRNEGLSDSQWPFTFSYAPQQQPRIVQTIDVPQPTAVATGFPVWGNESYAKTTYLTTMEGGLQLYDVGNLNTPTSDAKSQPALARTVAIGKNPTTIAYGRQAPKADELYILSRGDKTIYQVRSNGDIASSMRDSRMVDPVAIEISQSSRYCGGYAAVSVLDYGGKQAINYVPSTWYMNDDGRTYTTDTTWHFGYATPTPGKPFMFTLAEVI